MKTYTTLGLFPLEATDTISIKGAEYDIYSIRIYNASGEMVKIFNHLLSNECISVNDLKEGEYLAHLNNSVHYRIIKFRKVMT